jgi:rhodanese-related sulfurtransferase
VSRRRTIDDVLEQARLRLERLSPEEAYRAAQAGAVIVDTRSPDEQREQGVRIPGALHYPLSVVPWRLDPSLETANPDIGLDAHVILICRHGYSSSLAAALLREIGFERATDVVGGAQAWKEAGLPVEPL